MTARPEASRATSGPELIAPRVDPDSNAGASGRSEAASARSPFPVLTPLLEAWQRIALVFVLAVIGTVAARLLLVSRRYEARATLMTVSSQRSVTGAGGLAALSMLAGQGSGSTPPDLVAQVLVARHVLLKVGLSRVDSSTPVRIIDRLRDETRADVRTPDVERAVSGAIQVSIDRKTGLLDVSARHRDPVLARLLVTRDVEIGAAAFAAMMRAQASAQRVGQEERVRLTASQLRVAEARQLDFLRSNRIASPYSVSALEQQAIQRDIQIAQQAYTEAVTAREAAYARELEQTPAVVVVDPVPAELPAVPRYTLFYALAVGVFAAFVYGTLILIQEGLLSLRSEADPAALRFIHAVRRIPILGRLAPRE